MTIANRSVYTTQPQSLRTQISALLKKASAPNVPGEVLALIVPDTNLMSGSDVAASVFKAVEGAQYDAVILIAPSHTGGFGRMTICSVDTYRTPLGDLVVSDRVRNELCDEDDDIYLDDRGHFHTEGVDVQLPFLQVALDGDFEIVPIVMGEESPDFCRELAHAVGEIMYNRRTLLVASADILGGDAEGLQRFREYLEEGDASRLMGLLNSEDVRVEGKGAVVVALMAAQHRRADKIDVIELQAPQGEQPGCIGAVLWRA